MYNINSVFSIKGNDRKQTQVENAATEDPVAKRITIFKNRKLEAR